MKSSIYQNLVRTFDMAAPQGVQRTGAQYYINNKFLQVIKYERANIWAIGFCVAVKPFKFFNSVSSVYLIQGLKVERFI